MPVAWKTDALGEKGTDKKPTEHCGKPTKNSLSSDENPSGYSGSFVSPRDDGAVHPSTIFWINVYLVFFEQLRDLPDLSPRDDGADFFDCSRII